MTRNEIIENLEGIGRQEYADSWGPDSSITETCREAAALLRAQGDVPRDERRAGIIEGFRSLNENWDSYGAEKLPEETIQLALWVSGKLGPEWKVIPCADGPSAWFYRGDEDDIIQVWSSPSNSPEST